MNKGAGFTLLELIVVVAVIAVIAAIAIPSLLRSRIQSNEAAAIQNLRTVVSAQVSFHTTNSRFGTIEELAGEDEAVETSYLDTTWSDGSPRQGYAFVIEEATTGFFVCYADPVDHNVSGSRFFRVDPSGVIRWNEDNRPAENDPEIGRQF